jgi:outer membrane protein assembly factor BamD (BamD/ComL family)
MKLYETGILYLKMDEFEPARMSFNRVLDQFYDTDIVEKVHFGVIQSFVKDNKLEQAKEYWLDKGSKDIVNEALISEIDQLFAKSEK